MHKEVVVVGAGMGGLAAAVELAAAGLAVRVVERGPAPGGKLVPVRVAGQHLDAGPTVLTMRWVFEELYAGAGASFGAAVALRQAQRIARHAWADGQRLDLHASRAASAEAIALFAGRAESRRYLAMCRRAAAVHAALEPTFLRAPRPAGPAALAWRFGLRGLPALCRIAPFTSLWRALARELQHPRLRQLFARYATYCGSSPFLAPATLLLVSHVEQDGVWLVDGGMQQLATTTAGLAMRLGVQFQHDAEVARIDVHGGRVRGVVLTTGEPLPASAVVFNGDAAALGSGLLGDACRAAGQGAPAHQRSLSALTWNLVARTRGLPLLRHNVFFSDGYREEFEVLVGQRRLPAQPTVYVCAHDRDAGDGVPPDGPERLLCLVNAPATGDGPADARAVRSARDAAFRQLRRCGLEVDLDEAACVQRDPATFAGLYPGTGGALYGAASHGWQAAFRRPGSRTAVEGLYLAGGSTHPGPGLPMAALSGRLAAAALLADLVPPRAGRLA